MVLKHTVQTKATQLNCVLSLQTFSYGNQKTTFFKNFLHKFFANTFKNVYRIYYRTSYTLRHKNYSRWNFQNETILYSKY